MNSAPREPTVSISPPATLDALLPATARRSERSPVDLGLRSAAIYRAAAGRTRATPIRQCGDFKAAEDATHDALNAALRRWPEPGVTAPSRPCFRTISRAARAQAPALTRAEPERRSLQKRLRELG